MTEEQNSIERDRIDIVCLIDRSENMADSAKKVIETFNSWLEHYQQNQVKARLSIILFGETQEWLCANMPLEYAKPLTADVYQTIGNAALNDGIGKVLTRVIDAQRSEGYPERPTAVVTVTNARENWSKNWTFAQIQELVKQQEAAGWEFNHLLLNPLAEQFETPRVKTLFEAGVFLDVVCVLDRSGSMSGTESETIEQYNMFINRQKESGRPALVTLVIFDDQYEVVYENCPVAEVPVLTREKYFARGGTAYYDALGRVLSARRPAEGEKANRVILVITDGYNNASREFNLDEVQKMVAQQEDHGAKVSFIGADLRSAKEMGVGARMHADPCRTMSAGAYAASYSCSVPPIQSFSAPAYQQEGVSNIKAMFLNCAETVETFPMQYKAEQQQHTSVESN